MRLRNVLHPMTEAEWEAEVLRLARRVGARHEACLRTIEAMGRTEGDSATAKQMADIERNSRAHDAAIADMNERMIGLWLRRRAGLTVTPEKAYHGTFAHDDTDRKATRTVRAKTLAAARAKLRRAATAMGPRWSLASVTTVKR